MELYVYLLMFSLLWRASYCVKCYSCLSHLPYGRSPDPLCSEFDYSERFVKDCDTSTVCFKKVVYLTTEGIQSQTVERGCAPQTLSGDQRKRGRHWEPVTVIYEAYEMGCEEENSEESVVQRTRCYCRGDYCNSGLKTKISYVILFLTSFIWFFIS